MAYSFTDQQARTYYNTLPPDEKARVDASGGPSVAWFQNAVGAGVPDAVRAAGGMSGQYEGGWQAGGDYTLDPSQAADPSDWMGKRMPTAQEFRKWAQQQHQAYTSGDTSAQDEDYQRYGDAQIAGWLNEGWDATAGGWKAGYDAHGKMGQAGGGGGGGGGGRGGGGGGGAASFGQAGGVPQFNFQAPSYQDMLNDPGYQSRLKEGQTAIQQSAAAKGALRTGNTLVGLDRYSQDYASQEYDKLYGRAYDLAKAKFAPQYGGWQTQYAGDLSRWTTNQNTSLQKYLQNEGNIYGMIMGGQPVYNGGYAGGY